jgi:hypothetical protein
MLTHTTEKSNENHFTVHEFIYSSADESSMEYIMLTPLATL